MFEAAILIPAGTAAIGAVTVVEHVIIDRPAHHQGYVQDPGAIGLLVQVRIEGGAAGDDSDGGVEQVVAVAVEKAVDLGGALAGAGAGHEAHSVAVVSGRAAAPAAGLLHDPGGDKAERRGAIKAGKPVPRRLRRREAPFAAGIIAVAVRDRAVSLDLHRHGLAGGEIAGRGRSGIGMVLRQPACFEAGPGISPLGAGICNCQLQLPALAGLPGAIPAVADHEVAFGIPGGNGNGTGGELVGRQSSPGGKIRKGVTAAAKQQHDDHEIDRFVVLAPVDMLEPPGPLFISPSPDPPAQYSRRPFAG